jgi:hypothetical protein
VCSSDLLRKAQELEHRQQELDEQKLRVE